MFKRHGFVSSILVEASFAINPQTIADQREFALLQNRGTLAA